MFKIEGISLDLEKNLQEKTAQFHSEDLLHNPDCQIESIKGYYWTDFFLWRKSRELIIQKFEKRYKTNKLI